jgi:hypothetical protein
MDEQGRICTKCGEWKPWEAFSLDPNQRSGRHPYCKVCKTAAYRRRYASDPSVKQYQLAYQRDSEHREAHRAAARAYYQRNRQTELDRRRASRQRIKQQGRVLPSTDKETAHGPT